MAEPNVLMLDEPTNDLDTDTLQALEDLLDSWPGTLIVVSHDRYLVERVCDDVVALLGDGRITQMVGGIDGVPAPPGGGDRSIGGPGAATGRLRQPTAGRRIDGVGQRGCSARNCSGWSGGWSRWSARSSRAARPAGRCRRRLRRGRRLDRRADCAVTRRAGRRRARVADGRRASSRADILERLTARRRSGAVGAATSASIAARAGAEVLAPGTVVASAPAAQAHRSARAATCPPPRRPPARR